MTPVTVFRGKTVAVFGLGSSGLAACAALTAGGAKVIASDDQEKGVAAAAAKGFVTGDLRTADWKNIAALVLAPGVPLTHPEPHWSVKLARAHKVEVIGDIELFCRERRASARGSPFIAITGTNGKSTTTALIGHLIAAAGREAAVGGNLGTPILSLPPPDEKRTHVIECSSYQIDLAPTLDPTVGILLNITPDHLDRHGTIENYAAIKERLVAGVEAGGTAVIGVDDEFCAAIADRIERAGKRVVRVSVERKLRDGIYRDGDVSVDRRRRSRRVARSISPGLEVCAACIMRRTRRRLMPRCERSGWGTTKSRRGFGVFPALRTAWKKSAARAACCSSTTRKRPTRTPPRGRSPVFHDIFWIAGGRAKEGGIEPLREFFPRIRKAYLIGEAAADFAKTLGSAVKFEKVDTLERAVPLAAHEAEASGLKEPVVLLSPACASFDQYPNFEVRGDAFRELVRKP